MTDNTAPAAVEDTAEPAETPVAASEPATEGDALDPQDQRLSEEAARWRRQARAEETNRLIAEARVAELQRAEINRHIATRLASADDFWLVPGVNFDDFIVDGEVDLDAVNTKADEIIASRPHWKARMAPVGAPSAAVQGDGRYDVPAAEEPTWEGLLKGKTAG